MYKILFLANYSGRVSLFSREYNFSTEEEARTKKEARRKAAELKRKFGGAYTEIEILDMESKETIYYRKYGKLL